MKACLFNTYLYRQTLYLSLTCCMRTCPPVDHAGVWKDAQNHHLPPLEEDAGPDSCGTNHDYQKQQRARERDNDRSINQSIDLSFYPSKFFSIYLSKDQSKDLSIQVVIYLTNNSIDNLTTYLSICVPV